ncbi:MAG: hypothetical protein MI919_00470 [Holophagales bacterium]|nr:hypothetical protein [Holophagales bacterium]
MFKLHKLVLALFLWLTGSLLPGPDSARGSALPFFFEHNQGQAQQKAHFIARANGYRAQLEEHRILISPSDGEQPDLSLSWHGRAVEPEGLEPLAGRVSYYHGNDPERWVRDAPTFARARYAAILPGIDLELYGRDGHVEYDFVVAPGADPAGIRVTFEGLTPRLGADGRLEVGGFVQPAPVIYQNTESGRRVIDGRYLIDGRRVGFELGSYDPALPLIIDPVLVYSSHLGGDEEDSGQGIALDNERHAYVVGGTRSSAFLTDEPVTADLTHQGSIEDVFVAKISPDGTELVYLTFFGGLSRDSGTAIAVDDMGRAWVTGSTRSTDFPQVAAGYQPDFGGGTWDAFVALLNPDGNLERATYLGGSETDMSRRHNLALDQNLDVYVSGYTYSEDFPVDNSFGMAHNGGGSDAFIAKLDSDLGSLEWAAYYGGDSNDCESGCALEVDSEQRVYLSGTTESEGLATAGAFDETYSGDDDIVVVLIENDASGVLSATYLGGSGTELYSDLALEADGIVWVVGETWSEDFPTSDDAFQPDAGGVGDAFVVSLDMDLSGDDQLVYGTYYGGSGEEEGHGVAVSESGDVLLAGFASGASDDLHLVDPLDGAFGEGDALIVRFHQGEPNFATRYGGGEEEGAYAIAVDPVGAAYITGLTRSEDLPLLPLGDTIQTPLGGTRDAFVAKIDLPVGIPDAPFEYSVKVLCGVQPDPDDRRLTPGAYSTLINIHNPNYREVEFFKKLALAFPPGGQEPGALYPIASDQLLYDQALAVDCPDLEERVLLPQGIETDYIDGFVVIQSEHSLDVTAVYTTATLDEGGQPSSHSSIDVEQIAERARTPGADLRITKRARYDANPNGVFLSYIIEVTNLGPELATQVVVDDLLEAEIGTLTNWLAGSLSVSHGGAWVLGPLNPDAASLEGTIPLLPAGDTAVLEFGVHALQAGGALRLVDTAQVTSDVSDPDPSNNTTQLVTEVP